jgi:DhnA family fructose-bisphosphate aldolase class Ia
VRIAAEAGADVIKTRYPGSARQFRSTVESSGVPVIVAGGPRSDTTDRSLLDLASESVGAGAAGIIFGRNVWQHPRVEQLINALCAIVHDGETVESAVKILR